jgi:hypothetical protein
MAPAAAPESVEAVAIEARGIHLAVTVIARSKPLVASGFRLR